MDKRAVYSKKEVVKNYDTWRFGGRSGEYVDVREKEIVERFLDETQGIILDLACGTARFTELLTKEGKSVVAADYSLEMLNRARKKVDTDFLRCDVFSTPFKDSVFDGVVMGRFFQHYADAEPILLELKRIIKENGVIVFDTLKWSPRMIYTLFSKKDVRGVHRHSYKEIETILHKLNLEIADSKSIFIFAPGVYRFLPFSLVKLLDKIEKALPSNMMVRTFWKVRKWGAPLKVDSKLRNKKK